ncbi:ABC-type polar amino acid transport system [Fructobacillus fructosus]|uniref:amino acid ABC transporter ATP-binding protein n=1 Tax=Fructobacillus fructosus TaxID=1631 RepID=UPI000219607B|nr:ATP-binding cassette domain-containing protein [Fructobacillus fructosus]KRN52283.1 amino acid ABC transporter, ATP-binding protein [Fructobacillus fructosus KCTC 3544]GAP01365.1 amino acid ABC transporter, ATP-binding protein [Fructobacillus fructosus]CAK1245987.1 ABC-type polar amino acid transport system [Fructobacillus fructosus]
MIQIQNLTKQFGDKTIFKNLSLTLDDGEILTVMGPSGIGKTTLIKVLTGLEEAQSGTITIENEQFPVGTPQVSKQFALIFQDFNLFPHLTVKENIELAPKIVKKADQPSITQKTSELLRKLNITEQANLYPYQLSGGQKQRVAIARALAMEPQVIIYDEPTSGLDEQSTRQVESIMLQLKKEGVSQLVVTHDLPFEKTISDRTFDFTKEVSK